MCESPFLCLSVKDREDLSQKVRVKKKKTGNYYPEEERIETS